MKRKEVFYHFRSNDPKYVSIYGKMPMTLGAGASTRTEARKRAKYKAEREGWSDYWVEETTRIETTIKI